MINKYLVQWAMQNNKECKVGIPCICVLLHELISKTSQQRDSCGWAACMSQDLSFFLIHDGSKIHCTRWSAISHLGGEIRAALRGEKLSLSVVWDVMCVTKTTSFTELPPTAVNFPKSLEGHALCSHKLKRTGIKFTRFERRAPWSTLAFRRRSSLYSTSANSSLN
jgi:hypothetical protein